MLIGCWGARFVLKCGKAFEVHFENLAIQVLIFRQIFFAGVVVAKTPPTKIVVPVRKPVFQEFDVIDNFAGPDRQLPIFLDQEALL